MPKERETQREFNLRIIHMYPKVFRENQRKLMCLFCDCDISCKKLFGIKQHLDSLKHKKRVEAQNKQNSIRLNQSLILDHREKKGPTLSELNMDLCKTLLEANIPLNIVNNASVVKFLEKYTSKSVPDQSTLRRNYVPHLYENLTEKLRSKAAGKHIWVSVDETTDVEQRMVANFVFGILYDENERGNSYLLNVMELEKVNSHTIATFFTDSLLLLWPNGIQYEKFLLVATDAVAYMLCAMKSLQVLFPKMLHVTCFAHGLHCLAEFIRQQFPKVNDLISSVKSVFVKSPARRQLFKNANPGIPLSPEPVITRWGTWLKACVYYADHFDAVKLTVDNLDENDAESIRKSQKVFASAKVRKHLAFIKANFTCIVDGIKKLESKGLDLKICIDIIENVRSNLNSMEKKEFLEKFERILTRNVGFKSLVQIKNIINLHNDTNTNEYTEKKMQ